jgi:hypothetical protein
MKELIRVLLQQARSAEKSDSSRGNVIGGELERPEHSAAIEERPGDATDAFDPDTVSETSKMGCRRLIQRPDEVGSLVRDRQARTRVPDHLEEFLLLGLGVLRNGREGLLDPLWNGGQVGLRHGFEEGWPVIDQQAEVFTG